ncbi:hypothetical protein [Pseudomonas putida]|nr:hypothetical protein [Pseudomonas putida]
MKLKILALCSLALASTMATAESLSEMYPGPWRSGPSQSITKALAEQGVEGCKKYRYRVAAKSESEFLVYCYRGGDAKSAYMVWPNIHKVLGPYQPDSSL